MTDEATHPEPAVAAGTPSQEGSRTPAAVVAGEGPIPGIPAPPPDDENPAIIDAHKTFIITMVSIGLFVAFSVLFVL